MDNEVARLDSVSVIYKASLGAHTCLVSSRELNTAQNDYRFAIHA